MGSKREENDVSVNVIFDKKPTGFRDVERKRRIMDASCAFVSSS